MIGSSGVMSTTPETEHTPPTILPAAGKKERKIEMDFFIASTQSGRLRFTLKADGQYRTWFDAED